jgi:hypothetical protein
MKNTLVLIFFLVKSFLSEEAYLPDEILENYSEYVQLEDFQNTCSIEKQIAEYGEEKLKEYILNQKCIPDLKSFNLILEEGWQELINFIVQDIYLPNLIDPSQPLYVYFNKNLSNIKVFNNLIVDFNSMKNMSVVYSHEVKSDDTIQIKAKIANHNYVPLYTNVFCYKDMLIVTAVFKNKQNQLFRLYDVKHLYDTMSSKECNFSYNYFNFSFEITFQKENKFKVWEKLFKS